MRRQAAVAGITPETKVSHGFLLCCLVAFLLVPLPGGAQDGKKQRDFEFPVHWEFRIRPEIRQDYDLKSALDDDNYPVLQRFRFSIGPRYKAMRLFVQLQDSSVWNGDKSPYTSANFHLFQTYLEAPVIRGYRIRVGRQELALAEERLVGAFNWDNKGRSFDAATLYRESKTWSIRFFAANLPAPRVDDFPRGQNLFGAYWKRTVRNGNLEVYSVWLHDQTVVKGEKEPGKTRILTTAIRFSRQGGPWKQNAEFAWQAGSRNHDSHLAAAFTARADYAWKARWSPSLGGEYSFATGDGDSTDGRSREFHNLYPTNHFFYGYMDLFGWRNLNNPRVIFSVQPIPRIRLEVDYLEFWLQQSKGAWKNAGGRLMGRDVTGRSGSHVGGEMDLYATLNLTPHYRLLGGWSIFAPGSMAQAVRGGTNARLGYIQLLVGY